MSPWWKPWARREPVLEHLILVDPFLPGPEVSPLTAKTLTRENLDVHARLSVAHGFWEEQRRRQNGAPDTGVLIGWTQAEFAASLARNTRALGFSVKDVEQAFQRPGRVSVEIRGGPRGSVVPCIRCGNRVASPTGPGGALECPVCKDRDRRDWATKGPG